MFPCHQKVRQFSTSEVCLKAQTSPAQKVTFSLQQVLQSYTWGGRGPAQLHSWLISMCRSVGSPGDVPWRVWGSRFRVNSLGASQILNRLLPACVGSCLQGWLWPVCPGDGGARVASLAAQWDRSPQSPQAPQLQRDCCILGREFVGEMMSLVSVIR